MKIYITRHSLTAWNEEKRLQGWKDSPLTKQGKEDALKLGEYMKTTGVIRRIDELGRIVIPKEIRKSLRIKNGESLEVYLDGDSIILKKFSQIESLESISVDYVEAFNQIIKHNIIVTDRDKVVAVSGPLKKKYLGKNINEFTERSIERRDSFSEKQKKEFKIIEDEEDVGYYTFASIVNNGDAIGSVILISLDTPLSDTEDKLAIVLSNLLSKQFID